MTLTPDMYNCWPGGQEPTAEEIQSCDALEIHPLLNASETDDETWYEPCDRDDAEIWGVYLHLKEGGIESLTDCQTEADALLIGNALAGIWDLDLHCFY
ncbi:hypothetical protein [Roseibium alexandrii]|uniref:Uncharacterized protein n=1 Tax=Roseibium alexandrii (strain DSM 17067 / NCIMB 14079 / DFL-11) TaxID=244592 RepID=A0A5E8GT17_ROSAD|nr:hypothetical protein [Roseibium alexandrii]EEE42868.1 hypothetical protein SADFL11_PLAS40 [Roseibium alexandrii DFL-11]